MSEGRRWAGKQSRATKLLRIVSPWEGWYLGMTPLYPPDHFWNVFHVPRTILERLHETLTESTPDLWGTRRGAIGKEGDRSEIKILACLRKMDDQVQMGL